MKIYDIKNKLKRPVWYILFFLVTFSTLIITFIVFLNITKLSSKALLEFLSDYWGIPLVYILSIALFFYVSTLVESSFIIRRSFNQLIFVLDEFITLLVALVLAGMVWLLLGPKFSTYLSLPKSSPTDTTKTISLFKYNKADSVNLITEDRLRAFEKRQEHFFQSVEERQKRAFQSFDSSEGRMLSLMEVLAAVLTIAGAILVFIVRRKVNDVEKLTGQIESLNQSLIISTELILLRLPDFTETQHIPMEVVKMLREIERLVFRNSEIQNTLERQGNGSRLDLAMGVYLFSQKDNICRKYFAKVKKNQLAEMNIRMCARIRLGIAYRQYKNYVQSKNEFEDIINETSIGEYFNEVAQIGKSITLIAMGKTEDAYNELKSLWNNKEISSGTKVFAGFYYLRSLIKEKSSYEIIRGEEEKLKEINEFMEEKIIKIRESSTGGEIKGINLIGPFHSDKAIQANFFEAIGISYFIFWKRNLNNKQKRYKNICRIAFNNAKNAVQELKKQRYDLQVTVLSEEELRDVSVEQFENEIDKFKILVS